VQRCKNKIVFPQSLNVLNFWAHQEIKNHIPNCIEKLFINNCFIQKKGSNVDYDDIEYNYITNLPSSIKEITINNKIDMILIKKIPFGCIIKDINGNILVTN
jgi:hypothetical protein